MSMASRWAYQRSHSLSWSGQRLTADSSSNSRPRRADPLDRRAAARAVGRGRRNGVSVALARVDLDPDDLGDDLAGLLDDHGVADRGCPCARARRRCAGVARFTVVPASSDRLELGHRRELAGLADLDLISDQPGDRLLGLVLESDRPARALAPRAQPLALVQVVDLHHQAVGLEIERVPLVAPALGRARSPARSSRSGPCAGSPGCPIASSRRVIAKYDVSSIPCDSPRPCEMNRSRRWAQSFGIEQLERAGGRIAGIGERGFARGAAQLVEPDQLGVGHVDLAADLEQAGGSAVERRSGISWTVFSWP